MSIALRVYYVTIPVTAEFILTALQANRFLETGKGNDAVNRWVEGGDEQSVVSARVHPNDRGGCEASYSVCL